jgi:hypothetical protein
VTELDQSFTVHNPLGRLVAYTHWRRDGDDFGLTKDQARRLALSLAKGPVLLVTSLGALAA